MAVSKMKRLRGENNDELLTSVVPKQSRRKYKNKRDFFFCGIIAQKTLKDGK